MPAVKCPSCGHRNFRVSSACINCGAPLASPSPQITEVDTSSIDANLPQAPIRPESSPLPRLPAGLSSRLPVAKKNAGMQPASSALPAEKKHTSLEPYMHTPRPIVAPSASSLFERSRSYDYDDYQDQNVGQTIVTEMQSSNSSVKSRPASGQATEQWIRDDFPWWFPRRKPELEGMVIHVQSQQVELHMYDTFGSFIRIFRDILWAMPGDVEQNKERKEMIQVTTVRVRALDNKQKEAIIKGYFTRANMSLGDKVSLWGWKRSGVLLVRRAYNHTSHAVVSTRLMSSSLPFLFLTALLIAGLVFLFMTHHITVPFLQNLLPGTH